MLHRRFQNTALGQIQGQARISPKNLRKTAVHTATRPFATVGVSLIGAAAIALTPVVVPTVGTQLHRAEAQIEQVAVQLAADANPLDMISPLPSAVAISWASVVREAAQYLLSELRYVPWPVLTKAGKNLNIALQDIRQLITNPGSLVVNHTGNPGVSFNPSPSLISALGTALYDIVTNVPTALVGAAGGVLRGNVEEANNQVILAALSAVVPLFQLIDPLMNTIARPLQGLVNAIETLGPWGVIAAYPLQNTVNVLNVMGKSYWGTAQNLSHTMEVAIGQLGPLISTWGALGTGVQRILNAVGTGDLGNVVRAMQKLPWTLMDGLLMGNAASSYGPSIYGPNSYGPNLAHILKLDSITWVGEPNSYPAQVYAGGLLTFRNIRFNAGPHPSLFIKLTSPILSWQQLLIDIASRALQPPSLKAAPAAAAVTSEDLPAANALPLVNAPTIALPAATAALAKTAMADDSSKTADSVKKDRHDKRKAAAAVVGINAGSDTKAANGTRTDAKVDAGKGTDSGKSSDTGGSSSAGSGDKGSNTGSTDRVKGHGKGSRSSGNSSNTKPAKENTKSVKAHSAGKSSSGGHRSPAK